MVCHKDPSMNITLMLVTRFLQDGSKTMIIFITDKNGGTVITPLNNMLWLTG